MYIPLFLCMFFGVCLLCVGVKTDTKRDVALQREKHQKGEGGTRALSDFSSVHKENHKKERAKTETEGKNSKYRRKQRRKENKRKRVLRK